MQPLAEKKGVLLQRKVNVADCSCLLYTSLEQVKTKALGFNVGGKIGIARCGEHLCVAIYMAVETRKYALSAASRAGYGIRWSGYR